MIEAVIDCSLALAWVLPDETSPRADRLRRRLSRGSRLWVPALWWYELSNVLVTAQRRKRLTEADARLAIEHYRRLPIETEFERDTESLWRACLMAVRYGLSAYDAAYLEIAHRKGLRLATLDRALISAAHKAGVSVIPL